MSAGTASRVSKKTWSDDELMQIEHEGKVELVNGDLLFFMPAGLEQEDVAMALVTALRPYVRRHRLGRIYGAQAGFRLVDNLRCPDVSFVRTERLPGGRSPKGFGHFAPDLAVEVLAPKQSLKYYSDKIAEYFSWGVRLVWLIDPKAKTVMVFTSAKESQRLTVDDELQGGDVISGFACRVAELFE
jgi:Uma2 family endonuclease